VVVFCYDRIVETELIQFTAEEGFYSYGFLDFVIWISVGLAALLMILSLVNIFLIFLHLWRKQPIKKNVKRFGITFSLLIVSTILYLYLILT